LGGILGVGNTAAEQFESIQIKYAHLLNIDGRISDLVDHDGDLQPAVCASLGQLLDKRGSF